MRFVSSGIDWPVEWLSNHIIIVLQKVLGRVMHPAGDQKEQQRQKNEIAMWFCSLHCSDDCVMCNDGGNWLHSNSAQFSSDDEMAENWYCFACEEQTMVDSCGFFWRGRGMSYTVQSPALIVDAIQWRVIWVVHQNHLVPCCHVQSLSGSEAMPIILGPVLAAATDWASKIVSITLTFSHQITNQKHSTLGYDAQSKK